MGDTKDGSWTSKELGGYIRSLNARLDRVEERNEVYVHNCRALGKLERVWASLYMMPLEPSIRLKAATTLKICQEKVTRDIIDFAAREEGV